MTIFIIVRQTAEDMDVKGYGYVNEATAQAEVDRLNRLHDTKRYEVCYIEVRDYGGVAD